MQIIEVTGLGVRSAVITLRAPGTALRFRLFPMVHVASPVFYQQVALRLRDCDLIVAEGVRGRSMRLSTLTLAYRFAPRFSRGGLQMQSEAVLPAAVPVINVDSTTAELSADLATLPRLTRFLMLALAPLFGLVFALRGPQAFLDHDLAVDDFPLTRDAEQHANDEVAEILVERRDRKLLDALDRLHTEYQDRDMVIAVVYGAGHMPGIAAGLRDRHGYRPREAEWLTVSAPR